MERFGAWTPFAWMAYAPTTEGEATRAGRNTRVRARATTSVAGNEAGPSTDPESATFAYLSHSDVHSSMRLYNVQST